MSTFINISTDADFNIFDIDIENTDDVIAFILLISICIIGLSPVATKIKSWFCAKFTLLTLDAVNQVTVKTFEINSALLL